MDLENIGFTYFHDSLGHKCFINHFFVHRELLPLISYLNILENGANVSDHLPIALCLAVPVVKCDKTALIDSFVHRFRWDKGDIINCYEQTGYASSIAAVMLPDRSSALSQPSTATLSVIAASHTVSSAASTAVAAIEPDDAGSQHTSHDQLAPCQ